MKTKYEKWVLPRSDWTRYLIHVCSRKMPEQIWVERTGKEIRLMFGQGNAGKRGDLLTESNLTSMGYKILKK